ncbi:acetyl-CoA carboxylase biotin carboxyl carrier protein subunit [Pollutimonas thiosulfatoxidans]|uniref:Acetyl-CoA carboxylase biotin carboxyl carrier protein subunit n=1 Tax=Pollutimonas thiosulfatoxidans TaxID=2028345 RepID=A0A410GEX4_9BURK|nr:acetyl-CoA carboxylase biotin carboxyl carrier protein subunit [Pollutimonas thiosulfatoxidans]QAA94856.1 acetyl-CoA carboxylase biotin carboxyl carrier protein subunit [Pollutimonas thiosulfatoxidans]
MARTEIGSPVTGTVWKVERAVGDKVEDGDVIMILESMKMEIPLEATCAGVIAELTVEPGASVDEDQILCVLES